MGLVTWGQAENGEPRPRSRQGSEPRRPGPVDAAEAVEGDGPVGRIPRREGWLEAVHAVWLGTILGRDR